MTISIDRAILSEDQSKRYNPLAIRIAGLNSMPNTPHSFEQLDTFCEPTTVRISFMSDTSASIPTQERRHLASPLVDDTVVFLTGLYHFDALQKSLQFDSGCCRIEVHDREPSLTRRPLEATSLFGTLKDEQAEAIQRNSAHSAGETNLICSCQAL